MAHKVAPSAVEALKAYKAAHPGFAQMFDKMTRLVEKGIHKVQAADAQVKKVVDSTLKRVVPKKRPTLTAPEAIEDALVPTKKAAKILDKSSPGASSASEGITLETQSLSQYWPKQVEFKGNKVYQRNDIIDPKRVNESGVSSLELMKKGNAPIGPDNNPINLHHMLQTNEGAIAEMTKSFHKQNTGVIHINPTTIPSGIDRNAFKVAW